MIQLAARGDFTFLYQESAGRWVLRAGRRGQGALPIRALPFVIGRSLDCQLVLPHSEDLSRATSRWHCHLFEKGGEAWVADGSLHEVPELRARKPSITGTWLNGKRLSAPAPLKIGDRLRAGPWEFEAESRRDSSVDIDGVLTRLAPKKGRPITESDPGARADFAQLNDLYADLGQTADSDEVLVAVLGFALLKLRPARVAAVLVFNPDGTASTRMAWHKGTGRITDFRFSESLVKSMPGERPLLLKTRGGDPTRSQVEQDITSAILVPLRGHSGRLGLLYLDNRASGDSFSSQDLALASAISSVISLQLSLERQAFLARVEHNMAQYFGPDVARLIVEESRQGRPVSLGVRECQATILFTDMHGFSAWCRHRTPQQVADILNPYFALAAECIQRHGGHVDKFIGDGVLGVFGAGPLQAPRAAAANHAEQGLRAALEILDLWARRSNSVADFLPLRAGLNSGKVVIGNVGCPGRIEYSVLGDTVNLAARMEHAAGANAVALTEATRMLLKESFPLDDGGEVAIKGFGPVKIWRIGP